MVRNLIGSVSSGTMRTEDLIPCFMDVAQDIIDSTDKDSDKSDIIGHIGETLAEIEQGMFGEDGEVIEGYYESENALYDLEALFDLLNEFAPPYFYFGSHPGDGADYGFWLTEDISREVEDNGGLIVSDTSEVPSDYSGEVLHVNDHGNCTLYACDNGQLTEVWSIV